MLMVMAMLVVMADGWWIAAWVVDAGESEGTWLEEIASHSNCNLDIRYMM